ncbi:hypothetical protein PR048_003951 [Dryococelus australis]|uniref:Uncharacterized protein n=1 Tax=Dryococelus australis TaxID=614101 RepID=A0ABQ9I444_9NEOP|nr:hypothetical protein PR048_003951 [Dryococelus australis]
MKKLATLSSGIEKLKFYTTRERERATRPLEIIHTHVCGPLDTTSDSFRSFVTFLGDYTDF